MQASGKIREKRRGKRAGRKKAEISGRADLHACPGKKPGLVLVRLLLRPPSPPPAANHYHCKTVELFMTLGPDRQCLHYRPAARLRPRE
ncbi:Hypothetical protein NTJ_03237 [Nesidiocoris tenuis]|uniref:Uncharacterized protein n=1 Tax=Nesidiocoris tenuis TaxID=355587 RepID=A0ABN7ADU4_9HEMI|nr:Hypothetical protein NTJ_03237 [Nesidiocoris tenuis]